MKKILSLVIASNIFCFAVTAQTLSKSDMVKFDFAILAQKKKKVQAKNAALMPAYNELIKNCNKLLSLKPASVMDKADTPPSGSKHDYMSIAPYWWPDTTKPGGVPYMRMDGHVTPETKNYADKTNLPNLFENVNLLALGYYFSNDEKYAKKATELLQVWFLDTATRMNPNMNFGQAVKGRSVGRAEALIDSRGLIYLLDGVKLISKSASWTPEKNVGLQKWVGDFLTWMRTNKLGIEELNAGNNHGIWYDAQELSYSLYLNDKPAAEKVIARSLNRLKAQMNADGVFPLEMERETSFHYSVFILNAFQIIAQLSDEMQVDYWNKDLGGKTLKNAYDNILPFVKKEKPWVGKQIKPFTFGNAFPLLLLSYEKYGCKDCMEFINKSEPDARKLVIQLL